MSFADVASSLCDANFWVRYQAAQSLAASTQEQIEPHAEMLSRLMTADESKLVRHEAAKALCVLGPGCRAFATQLRAALEDTEQLVRRDAAKAFASMGPAAASHADALVLRLEKEDFWPVRWWAARALSHSESGAALERAALADPEAAVREAAAKSVGAARDAETSIRSLAVHLAEGSERAVEALASALGGDARPRKNTARLLADLLRQAEGSERQRRHEVAALEVALGDEEWLTRKKALESLQRLVQET